ncbi:MAG: class I SAM-dependent methyltransferase [Candidatus Acidiferrales bacterium]
MTSDRVTKSIRQDWDERARKNAFYYIASWRSDWDLDSFFNSGEEDYKRLVEPILNELGFQASGKSMVEVGCGAGRMTRGFAQRFGRVSAVDISSEMQAQGKRYLSDFSNINWVLADGATLSGLETASSNFVFSYIVLQHLPQSSLAHGLLREFVRVLAPSGVFLFQYNGAQKPPMNWRGRTTWRIVNLFWSAGLRRAGRAIASGLGLDPEMVGKSWHGVALTKDEVGTVLRDAGATSLQFAGDETQMAWCWGKKATEDRG